MRSKRGRSLFLVALPAGSQPERSGIPHRTMNSRQRAIEEFQRHECFGRKRTSQIAGLLGGEAESRIVMFVPEHDDDTFPSVAESSQAKTNQLAPNLAALMVRQNGHRS